MIREITKISDIYKSITTREKCRKRGIKRSTFYVWSSCGERKRDENKKQNGDDYTIGFCVTIYLHTRSSTLNILMCIYVCVCVCVFSAPSCEHKRCRQKKKKWWIFSFSLCAYVCGLYRGVEDNELCALVSLVDAPRLWSFLSCIRVYWLVMLEFFNLEQ